MVVANDSVDKYKGTIFVPEEHFAPTMANPQQAQKQKTPLVV